jgi:hypothetical protein
MYCNVITERTERQQKHGNLTKIPGIPPIFLDSTGWGIRYKRDKPGMTEKYQARHIFEL